MYRYASIFGSMFPTGSRVYGTNSETSDYDYVVFLKEIGGFDSRSDVINYVANLYKAAGYDIEVVGDDLYHIFERNESDPIALLTDDFDYDSNSPVLTIASLIDNKVAHLIIVATLEEYNAWKYTTNLFLNNARLLKDYEYKPMFYAIRMYLASVGNDQSKSFRRFTEFLGKLTV